MYGMLLIQILTIISKSGHTWKIHEEWYELNLELLQRLDVN